MKLLTVTALAIGMALPATAGDFNYKPTYKTNVQGQHQGQKQSQRQKQGQAQGQSQRSVNANQYDGGNSVSAPGIAGGDACISAGGIYGAGGICWKSRHTRIIEEAHAANKFGGSGMAHLCKYNKRLAKSQNACQPRITDQSYGGTKLSSRNVARTKKAMTSLDFR